MGPEAGFAIWESGSCSYCHGPLANGDGDDAAPAGPNLRRTQLDRDGLIETIACGRPGTEMPYNLDGAYTVTACYDMPVGAAPADVFPGSAFTGEEIEMLADFLLEYAVGQSRVTLENCIVFYGGNPEARGCVEYR